MTGMVVVAARAVAAVLLLASATFSFAQETGGISFEVASVKRAVVADHDAPLFIRGGPGTPDPGRIVFERQNMMRLLYAAYGLDFDQVSGPAWLGTEIYSISVKVPPGTTEDQVKLMWQNLLAERFHFKAHMIQKDFPVYELSVLKGGLKLHKSREGPVRQEPGFPVLHEGEKRAVSRVPPRNARETFRDYSMAEFVKELGWPLSAMAPLYGLVLGRVIDRTGLDGHYDFTLEYAGGRGPGGAFPEPLPDGQLDTAPFLTEALRQQLGLVLVEKKAPVDVLVVDHADRIPTEN
jgi:uncharacterized protein (TIGR03435 family)